MSEKKQPGEKSNYFFYMTRHPKHMDAPAPPDFVQKLVTGTLSVALVTSMTPVVSFADEQDRAFSNDQATVQIQSQDNVGNIPAPGNAGSAITPILQQSGVEIKRQIADSLIKQISEKIVVDQVEHVGNAIALRFKIDDDTLARQYTIECRIVDSASDFGIDSTGAKVLGRQLENDPNKTIKDTVAFDVADPNVSNLDLNLGAIRFVIEDANGAIAETYQNLSPIQLKQDQWNYLANKAPAQGTSNGNVNAAESIQAAEGEKQAEKEQALLAQAMEKQQAIQTYIVEHNLDLSGVEDPALVVEPLLVGSAVSATADSGAVSTADDLTLGFVDGTLAWSSDSYTLNGSRSFINAMANDTELSSFVLSVVDANDPAAALVDANWKYVDGNGQEIPSDDLPVFISRDSAGVGLSTGQCKFTINKKASSVANDGVVDLSDIYIQYVENSSTSVAPSAPGLAPIDPINPTDPNPTNPTNPDSGNPDPTTPAESVAKGPKIALTEILGVRSFVFDVTAPAIAIDTTDAISDPTGNRAVIGPNNQSLIRISDENLAALIKEASSPTATDDLKNTSIATITDKSNSSVIYELTLDDIVSSPEGQDCAANGSTSISIPLKPNVTKGATGVTFENGTIIVPDGDYTVATATGLTDLSGNQVSTVNSENIVFKAVPSEVKIDTAAVQTTTEHDGVYHFNKTQLLTVSASAVDLAGLADSENGKSVVTIKGKTAQGQSFDDAVTVGDVKAAPNGSACIAVGDAKPSEGEPVVSLPEGEYELTFLPAIDAPIVDIAGSDLISSEGSAMAENGHIKFIYDTTAPAISKVTSDKNYVNSYADKSILFHKEQTTLTAEIEDGFGLMQDASFAGLWNGAKATYKIAGKANGSVTLDLVDGQELTPLQLLTVTDYAGNSSHWAISSKDGTYQEITQGITYQVEEQSPSETLFPDKVVQDTVQPSVLLSGVTAGTYYKDPVTASLDVNELNFRYLKDYDPDQIVLTIDKKSADPSLSESQTKIAVEQMTADDAAAGKYHYDQILDSDGHYSLAAQVVDPAGNTATTQVGEFTIDRTAPTIDFAWDNNDVQNGKYYKAGRTATVTVVEHNFDPSLVKIDAPGGSVGSWSTNGDTHTLKVSYNADAVCGLSVDVTDKAGNAASKRADEFVIDMTAPTITFASVEEGHAYNGEVTPIIEFADEANFNPAGTSYTLTGSKNGGVSYSVSESVSGNGSTVTYSDFEHVIGVDDIYTINAHLTDLAGNEFESDITFSVNRFGSTFMIVNPTTGERVNPMNPDDPNDFGFLSEAPEILIREVNVNPIDMDQSSVAVTYNLKTDYLDKVNGLDQPGFLLTESTTGDGWKSYDYTVSRNSFIGESNGSTDGSYQVEVSSYDSATNHNTSAQFWQEGAVDGGDGGEHESSAVVKFTLDTTDPEIYGVSVENGGVYANSGNYQVTFNAADNIGMKPEEIQVKLNGQNVEFTAVEGSNGQYAFNIDQGMLGFEDLVIEVKDYAGNTKTYHASFVDALWPAFLVVGIVIVIAAGIAVGMRMRRRRIAEEDA